MNPIQFLAQRSKEIGKSVLQGSQTADVLQRGMYSAAKEKGLRYNESILDPSFKAELAKKGITARQTPAQFAGAYLSRTLIDIANDGTRSHWWRWNHPLAVAQRVVELAIDPNVIKSPTARAMAGIGITLPAVAAAGAYDITNPEEAFRPQGFAQRYSPVGAEDRRQTGQVPQELFERFFLGRTGDPLKYATAKEEIPNLTPERYSNYMKFLYQDKGLLDLGIVKGTMENLKGYPEARILGYPVNIPMAAGFGTGALAATAAARTGGTPRQRAIRGIVGGIAGSTAGVALGNATNEAIAAANRPQLPTTTQYQDLTSDRI
jgi:hypothetical protein